jgi:hypothetical protein
MTRLKSIPFIALALGVAVGLAAGLSPFASAQPDGLMRVASDQGFLTTAGPHPLQQHSPIAGYAFPGVDNPHLAKGLAGFVGTLGVFAIAYASAWALRRARRGWRVPA